MHRKPIATRAFEVGSPELLLAANAEPRRPADSAASPIPPDRHPQGMARGDLRSQGLSTDYHCYFVCVSAGCPSSKLWSGLRILFLLGRTWLRDFGKHALLVGNWFSAPLRCLKVEHRIRFAMKRRKMIRGKQDVIFPIPCGCPCYEVFRY